jgi:hypothetical protein
MLLEVRNQIMKMNIKKLGCFLFLILISPIFIFAESNITTINNNESYEDSYNYTLIETDIFELQINDFIQERYIPKNNKLSYFLGFILILFIYQFLSKSFKITSLFLILLLISCFCVIIIMESSLQQSSLQQKEIVQITGLLKASTGSLFIIASLFFLIGFIIMFATKKYRTPEVFSTNSFISYLYSTSPTFYIVLTLIIIFIPSYLYFKFGDLNNAFKLLTIPITILFMFVLFMFFHVQLYTTKTRKPHDNYSETQGYSPYEKQNIHVYHSQKREDPLSVKNFFGIGNKKNNSFMDQLMGTTGKRNPPKQHALYGEMRENKRKPKKPFNPMDHL